MHRFTNKVILAFIMLLLTSLACTIFVGGPDYPAEPILFSMDAIESLHQQMEQSFESGAQTGIVNLQFNENQLTSYLILKLNSQSNPPFSDPQILLREGRLKIFGKVSKGIFLANMAAILKIGSDEAGLSKLEVESVDFGPFPAPVGLNEAITDILTEAYTGSFGPVATGFRLENISIADGLMTLTGRIK